MKLKTEWIPMLSLYDIERTWGVEKRTPLCLERYFWQAEGPADGWGIYPLYLMEKGKLIQETLEDFGPWPIYDEKDIQMRNEVRRFLHEHFPWVETIYVQF